MAQQLLQETVRFFLGSFGAVRFVRTPQSQTVEYCGKPPPRGPVSLAVRLEGSAFSGGEDFRDWIPFPLVENQENPDGLMPSSNA